MISITDINGKIVFEQNSINKSEVQIYQSLTSAIYFMKVKYVDGTYDIKKLIVTQ